MEVVIDNQKIKIVRMELGPWSTNAYIVVCPQTRDSALIDAPPGAENIIKNLGSTNLKYVLLTHNHLDHVEGLRVIRERVPAPLAVHIVEDQNRLPFPPEILLKDGDIICVGKVKMEVIFTPGHTPGSQCFRIGEYLLSGDTIFPGGPGRTDSPADFRQILRSLEQKIFILPDDLKIFPGHGDSTTLKKEKTGFNAFNSRLHDPDLCGDVTWV
jgi:hydroxyacylglutathione hydrolase